MHLYTMLSVCALFHWSIGHNIIQYSYIIYKYIKINKRTIISMTNKIHCHDYKNKIKNN